MVNPIKPQANAVNMKLAKHLRTLRYDAANTMRQLAITLGTAHSFVGKIEKQNRRLDVGEFVIYCQALGREPIEVLQEVMSLSEDTE